MTKVCHVYKNVTHKPIILYKQDVLIKTFLQDTGRSRLLDQPTIYQWARWPYKVIHRTVCFSRLLFMLLITGSGCCIFWRWQSEYKSDHCASVPLHPTHLSLWKPLLKQKVGVKDVQYFLKKILHEYFKENIARTTWLVINGLWEHIIHVFKWSVFQQSVHSNLG